MLRRNYEINLENEDQTEIPHGARKKISKKKKKNNNSKITQTNRIKKKQQRIHNEVENLKQLKHLKKKSNN